MKKNDEDKKEKILKKSKELILQRGYENISVNDITTAVNISKGSFYTYFYSKSEMIKKMIEESMNLLEKKKKRIFLKANSMEEIFHMYLWNCFEKDVEVLEIRLIILNIFQNLSKIEQTLLEYLSDLEKKDIHFWEKVLEKYKKNLSISEDDIKEYSFYISKMVQWFLISVFFSTEDSRFLLGNIKENVKKMDEEKVKKKINFLIKNIMKMLE